MSAIDSAVNIHAFRADRIVRPGAGAEPFAPEVAASLRSPWDDGELREGCTVTAKDPGISGNMLKNSAGPLLSEHPVRMGPLSKKVRIRQMKEHQALEKTMRYGTCFSEYLADEDLATSARFTQPVRYRDAPSIASACSAE